MTQDDANQRAARARKGSPFLNTAQTAHYIGLGERTLEGMRKESEGPFFRRHGRFIRYHIDDIDAWSRGEPEPRSFAPRETRRE